MTEKYVSPLGGGLHDGATPANAWSPSERATNAVAGDRCNWISGAYSLAGLTFLNSGTFADRIVDRGYNVSIGDLDKPKRLSSGVLDTTNFPVITTTGVIIPNSYTTWQNLVISGSVLDHIAGSGTPDHWILINCSITNTSSGSGVGAVELDNDCTAISCDFICTGAIVKTILEGDSRCPISHCYIKGAHTSGAYVSLRSSFNFSGNALIGSGGTSVGLNIENLNDNSWWIENNTFYNFGTDIQTPNSVQSYLPWILNNHYTDGAKGLDNLYAATANVLAVEMFSRTRDLTTPRTGFGDSLNIGEVTTDTGGAETDYVDAPNGNITLIATAPAVDAGLGM